MEMSEGVRGWEKGWCRMRKVRETSSKTGPGVWSFTLVGRGGKTRIESPDWLFILVLSISW